MKWKQSKGAVEHACITRRLSASRVSFLFLELFLCCTLQNRRGFCWGRVYVYVGWALLFSFFSLSVYLSICLSVCLFVYMSFSFSLSVSLSPPILFIIIYFSSTFSLKYCHRLNDGLSLKEPSHQSINYIMLH